MDFGYKIPEISENDYISILVEFKTEEDVKRIAQETNIEVIPLGFKYSIIRLKYKDKVYLDKYIRNVITDVVPNVYTLQSIQPLQASAADTFYNNPYLNLTGNGVIVGIIDTGIDYLSTEFMREDDTTRILSIWDQSIESEGKIYNTTLGTEYREAKINEAIQAKLQGKDPYEIVPSKDVIGHGTKMASLIGARGENKEVIGVVPNCNFVVVKLNEIPITWKKYLGVVGDVPSYSADNILLAIRYISNIASEFNKPAAIFIPLGCNIGAHDGTSYLEGYVTSTNSRIGMTTISTVGNQGDTETHTEGRIAKTGDIENIELKIGPKQEKLSFQIWVKGPDKVSISIVSPSGEVIPSIQVKLQKNEKIKFIYEGTVLYLSYEIPNVINGDELINIIMTDVKPGIWKFKLIGNLIIDGRYWGWLPQRELLDPETKFLSSSQYTTLELPSTSRDGIVAAYYDQNNTSIVGSSARGWTRDGRIKPDIAGGGINAKVILPGGGIGEASGASVAGAIVTGCVAQIMEWAIVKENDKDLYTTKVRTYLTRGATKREGDVYPNKEWGYGMVNMKEVFNQIRGFRGDEEPRYNEFYIGNLYIRKPIKN